MDIELEDYYDETCDNDESHKPFFLPLKKNNKGKIESISNRCLEFFIKKEKEMLEQKDKKLGLKSLDLLRFSEWKLDK